MKIMKGNNRIVYVPESYGVVIKLPIIRLREGCKCFFDLLKHPHLLNQLLLSTDYCGTPQRFLFRGIVSNWREFMFFIKTKNSFCSPTYFSFFGLFNVQKKEKTLDNSFKKHIMFKRVLALVDDRVYECAHTLANNKNFAVRDNKFLIVNYASKSMQNIICTHWEILMKR